ncbi:hypothetical protein DEJ17_04530 [Curtobacterium sp. MCSS17_011]|nr:hypothetical protein DEJ17_04530 [Curtobacterium sp. MCSS17_011]
MCWLDIGRFCVGWPRDDVDDVGVGANDFTEPMERICRCGRFDDDLFGIVVTVGFVSGSPAHTLIFAQATRQLLGRRWSYGVGWSTRSAWSAIRSLISDAASLLTAAERCCMARMSHSRPLSVSAAVFAFRV